MGEADYVKDILAERGAIRFWQVAMKPGRPLAFGRLGSAWFFGLPGNPVAVVVTFYQLVQPALRRLMGEALAIDPKFRVRCRDRLRKKPGRSEFQRGVLSVDAEGQLIVGKVGAQGSGILTSVARANCFILLSSTSGEVQPGDFVDVQPFHGLM